MFGTFISPENVIPINQNVLCLEFIVDTYINSIDVSFSITVITTRTKLLISGEFLNGTH